MNRMLRLWSLASAIALITVPAAIAAQGDSPAIDPHAIERLKAATGGRAEMSIRRGTGAVQFVRLAEGKGEASLAPQSARGASATEQAKAFFAEYGTIFGIQNAQGELEARDERADDLGFKHATLQQVHRGVPVFGAELKGHVDAAGRLVAVNGTGVPGISVDTTPRRSAADAGQIALTIVTDGKEKSSVNGVVVRNTRLVVYRTGLLQGIEGRDHLTYEVEVGNGGDVREFVFVDAHTGKKVDQITGIHDDLFRRAYNGLGLDTVPPSYPGSPFWVEGEPFPTSEIEADNMILASGETYGMFMNAFGYDSFDAAGATMDAIFNRGYGCPNASWNGTFISFCPGFTTDDVTAHEWGHAYTQYTHNLIYAWQSGALNESYSDIWGETVDLINNRGLDAPGGPRTEGQCTAFTPPVGQFQINTPASIARTSPAQSAGFGPPLSGTGVTGSVVVGLDAADAAGPLTTDGCSAFTNAAQVAGNIALVDRGTCNFSAKVYNAQLAGAVAVIVNNNVATGLPGMAAGVNAELVTIPSLGILKADGDAIKATLATSAVNATLRTTAGATDNSYRWLMGEEVIPFGALRDMFSPNCYANPGKVTDFAFYQCGPATSDQGGVHTNSGVPNKMFALLVDGGLFNSQNVRALGLTKAAHLYFRASFYHVNSTDFPEHADAMEQACDDLRGHPLASLTGAAGSQFITANDCAQVTKAIAAVELRTPPTQCAFVPQLAQNPPANVCVVGPANLLYSDNVEGSIAAWTRTNQGVFAEYTPRDWVKTSTLPGGRTGSAFFGLDDLNLGDCTPGSDDQSGVMFLDSQAITLPATPGFPRLVFDHYVATEPGWDGGNIKVSVNGGAYQNTVFTQFAFNPYKFALFTAAQGNTNPLAGQQAFTGADGGSNRGSWGRSILDLAGMAQPGDSIRLRFALGVDGCNGNDGWYVDDINVYQCTAGGAATLSIGDVTVTEGNSGSANATFTITLSEPSATTVTVRVNTANATATAGSDYTALTNVLVTFAPGVTTRTVNVPILGDTIVEATETFTVNLSLAANATIADGQGLGTITDNDPQLAPNPPANVCVVGPANLLFSENVEGSIAAWTLSNVGVFPEYISRDWVHTSTPLPGGRAGLAFFSKDDPNLGDCTPGNDQSGVTFLDSPDITLDATPGFPRLVIDHYVATEARWDGGNIKVSVNGGAWQNTSDAQFVYNPYRFTLFTTAEGNMNPLQGEQAFTGTDSGSTQGSWGQSILDLAGVAQPGDTIRLRFAFGTNGCGGNDGWYVDDINVYRCTAGGAATVSINDVTVTEGNSGSQNATFTLTLSEASSTTVTVRVSTADDTAVAPGDYTAVNNLLVTFAPGVTTRTVNVAVLGDTAIEADETFFVNLSSPTNVTILDGQGIGTITNNDVAPVIPTVSVNDVTHAEGQSGTTNATFTLTLSQSTTTTVTVRVDTADDTATAPSDYTAVSALIVTFTPGQTSRTVDVPVVDDQLIESTETFFVNVTVPVNATIADGQGVGTITDDDTAGGFFTVAPCRLIDTRTTPDGPYAGPALAAQGARVFLVAGQCGIPSTATAVVVNLAATGATGGGFFRAYAAAPAPNTSVLSFNAGVTRASNAIVGLNPAGEFTIFNGMASGTAHLVLDVSGYFE